jgi:hypothetical protein
MPAAHRASLRAGGIGMLAGSIGLMLRSDTEALVDWRRMTASIAPTCECCLPVMEQVSRH